MTEHAYESGRRSPIQDRAAALLDQQFWCWGRDIVRADGNALLEAGLCRHRALGVRRGCSLYTARVSGDAELWLWGFGLLYRAPELGCVFLRRFGFEPVRVERPPAAPVHRLEDLGPLARPAPGRERARTGALVRAATGWIAGYEHWIAEHFGTAYRAATLADRNRAPAVAAHEMARSWEHVAKKTHRLASTPGAPSGARGLFLAPLIPTAPPTRPPRPWERAHEARHPRYRTA